MTATPMKLAEVRTLAELLALRAAQSPQAQAYREFDITTGRWIGLTWGETAERVAQWRCALAAMQLAPHASVAVLLPNGVHAVSLDQSALSLGLVPVPLHAIDNPASIAYILSDSEASLLMVSSLAQWRAIEQLGLPLPSLRCVVLAEGLPNAGQQGAGVQVSSLADWLAAGKGYAGPMQAPSEDDLAAIVYTSGTTGKPKGVMLTHRNVVANVHAILTLVVPAVDDVFLSFLPLSHTFERTAGYYLPIAAGSCVAFARSVPLLAEDLKYIRPTMLISVPRIYERVHGKLLESLHASSLRSRLFEAAQAVGWRRFCRTHGITLGDGEDSAWAWLDPLAWPLLNRLVARKLQAQFGGRLRVAVSGGAPLAHAVARCFLGLGVPLLQGYGMTETSPVVSGNGVDDNDPATVGRALAGVEVRIGDNRELQVRGPSVMRGYWKRPEDTARVLAADGWLSTGDQADIVGGRIRIMGRIKEIIVTSTGEKVPPGDLELAIAVDPLFEQVFVVGENRPFIACVAVVNATEWKRLADSLALDAGDPATLRHPLVHKAALARIAAQTRSFARYAMPRAVHLTLEPWTIENTLMTPTLKLKRNNLMTRFTREIDAMYQPGRTSA
ncbi:MAG: long-chain fatty acid--CoA ligase [Polaromonas sp.]